MSDPRYPIGEFQFPEPFSPGLRAEAIARIKAQPAGLAAAVAGLTDRQLDTPYRDGGWTVRQVVHHVPDSHLNAYVRTKLALTEDHPTIRPYFEDRFARLPDTAAPVAPSLDLLQALHRRWITLLEALPGASFARTYFHPESKQDFSLDRMVSLYAWHGDHHIAHVTSLRRRMGW